MQFQFEHVELTPMPASSKPVTESCISESATCPWDLAHSPYHYLVSDHCEELPVLKICG